MDITEKDFSKIIGNAIRQGRVRRQWLQKDLAAFMNVAPSLISKWETGKAVPPGETLFKIAIELDIVPLLFSDYFPQSQQPAENYSLLKDEIVEIKRRINRIEETILVRS